MIIKRLTCMMRSKRSAAKTVMTLRNQSGGVNILPIRISNPDMGVVGHISFVFN
jgi:hypothetical protein